jgi:beta-1,4-mannosyl-glycoprotein beta-1,4-N-acetylglucosaminyltransferase
MQLQPLIIDAFCYNGESIAIQRLAYLYNHVDHFIIIEARESHSGHLKPELFFDKYAADLAPFMHKIIFFAIEKFPSMPEDWPCENAHHSWMNGNYDSWWRESYQRNMCKLVLSNKFENKRYVLICSDCDEIVRRDVIHQIRENMYDDLTQPVFLEMKFFYYSANWMKSYPWFKAFVINDQVALRYDLTHCRVNTPVSRYISNAGWHFSYFMTIQKLQEKLASFAHRECDQKEFSTIEHIESCLAFGRDLFNRGAYEDLIATPQIIIDEIPTYFKFFET